ncbi:LPXTG cell wall anchor domain-containing protein [Microbacterium proteolyticum]|uniref:LPXTG cell wall anchor domain-containing protein n=1 Tax=Microbacterium proteolyticum TaxID=1572644 RepID=UPI0035A84C68
MVGVILLVPALLCGSASTGAEDRPDSAAISVTVRISPQPASSPLPQDDCTIICGIQALPRTGGAVASLLLAAGGVALAGGVVLRRRSRHRARPRVVERLVMAGRGASGRSRVVCVDPA